MRILTQLTEGKTAALIRRSEFTHFYHNGDEFELLAMSPCEACMTPSSAGNPITLVNPSAASEKVIRELTEEIDDPNPAGYSELDAEICEWCNGDEERIQQGIERAQQDAEPEPGATVNPETGAIEIASDPLDVPE